VAKHVSAEGLESWTMSDEPVRVFSDNIVSIVRVEKDAYWIRVQISEKRLIETICRVGHTKLKSGKDIQTFNFDSRDFRGEIWNGNINSRAICTKVGAYHDQLVLCPRNLRT
jgi:hypothetical protein